MTANLRAYEDYLYHLPEKERKALEEVFFVEDEEESDLTKSLVKQINRRESVLRL